MYFEEKYKGKDFLYGGGGGRGPIIII